MQDFILALPVFVFSIVAHEYAHAAVARRHGDDTAYMLGRITMNPVPHVDPLMSVLVPALLWFQSNGAFTFGGAKPVPINPRKFRNYVRGDVAVSSAGVITNFILAIVFALLFVVIGLAARALPAATETLDVGQRMMMYGIRINLVLGFFNLIPIPPLDGSHLVYHLLPPAWGAQYRAVGRFGFLIIVGLMLLAPAVFGALLAPAGLALRAILGVVLPYHIADGWDIFSR